MRLYLVGDLNPSEKKILVSWDYDIPNIWKVIKFMFQTTSQHLSFHLRQKSKPSRPMELIPSPTLDGWPGVIFIGFFLWPWSHGEQRTLLQGAAEVADGYFSMVLKF